MEIRLLGTGTSQGVPVLACHCPVCTSSAPKDQRLRSSCLLIHQGQYLVIDAGPDFRQQMLQHRVPRLDAVLLTHEHRDHISGLDDLRAYNFAQDMHIPVYGLQRCLDDLRHNYAYMFGDYPGAPRLTLQPIDQDSQFTWQGLNIQTIGILHGKLPILGYRIGNFAYLTDVKTIPQDQLAKLQGLEVLVLNALHHEGHPTHLSLPEALDLVQVLQPQKTYLTHISHRMGLHDHVQATLPPHVHLAYDGLHFSVS